MKTKTRLVVAGAALAALTAAAPDLTPDRLPAVMAFGEALPMACDETAAGRRLNRRVELWLDGVADTAQVTRDLNALNNGQ